VIFLGCKNFTDGSASFLCDRVWMAAMEKVLEWNGSDWNGALYLVWGWVRKRE
jgi:hypothetical protein